MPWMKRNATNCGSVVAKGAEDRCGHEDDDRAAEHRARAIAVGHPAADRDEHREADEVRRQRELQRQRRLPDVGGDGRQRRRDDRRVHVFHEQRARDDQRDEDGALHELGYLRMMANRNCSYGGIMRRDAGWSHRSCCSARGRSLEESVPVIRFDSVPDPLKLPDGHVPRRSGRRGGEFEGTRLRLLARQHHGPGVRGGGGATARVRCGRQVRARDRPQSVRVVVRAHGARRRAGQHLGDRQGLGHGDQVQSRRAASRWCSGASRKPPTRTRRR